MSELAFVNDYLAPRKTIRGVIVSEDYSKRVAPDKRRGRKALAEKPADQVAAGFLTAAELRAGRAVRHEARSNLGARQRASRPR